MSCSAVNGRWYDDRIDIYDDVNIGVGTALGENDRSGHPSRAAMSLEIARALTDLTERARARKLTQDDVRGGTFSISITASRARWSPRRSSTSRNRRSSASASSKSALWCGTIRSSSPMAYVTLTIDHRVIDAFQTNAWLPKLVETLET